MSCPVLCRSGGLGQFAGKPWRNDRQTIYRARNDHDFLLDRAISVLIAVSERQDYSCVVCGVHLSALTSIYAPIRTIIRGSVTIIISVVNTSVDAASVSYT